MTVAACLFYAGPCDHQECADYYHDPGPVEQAGPTYEEQCAAEGHRYYGDDGPDDDRAGRCYCGARTYPPLGS